MRFVSRGFRGRRRDADVDPARMPPGQSVTRDFPVLSAGATPQTPRDRWTFRLQVGKAVTALQCETSSLSSPRMWPTS
jgi:hypothetical protein